MAKLKVNGQIIPNDHVRIYRDWFGMDCTCPNDVERAITEANGDKLIVEINSPGGEIASGSAIYTLLRDYGNIEIHILGQACSAASVIAMAGRSSMAPTALMMVHCVSTYGVSGNHNTMEHTAEMLRTADEALCTAYTAKSGMSKDDALAMMNHETWLRAEEALNYGLVDEVMFEESEGKGMAAGMFQLLTNEQIENIQTKMAKLKAGEEMSAAVETRAKELMAEWMRKVKIAQAKEKYLELIGRVQ